jgi:HEAT repeat protein
MDSRFRGNDIFRGTLIILQEKQMKNQLTLSQIKHLLESADSEDRIAAADHLMGLVHVIDLFPVNLVREAIRDRDDAVKIKIIEIFSNLSERLKEEDISAVISHLKSQNQAVRQAGLAAIPLLCWKITERDIREIAALCAHRDADIRFCATEALADLSHLLDSRLLSQISSLLSHDDPNVRQDFAELLLRIGQENILTDQGLL